MQDTFANYVPIQLPVKSLLKMQCGTFGMQSILSPFSLLFSFFFFFFTIFLETDISYLDFKLSRCLDDIFREHSKSFFPWS